MIRIRLSRVGKKGWPSYRIVVADVSAPRDGAYLEWIGNYDPMADPPLVTLKQDRAAHWLSMGASPSDAVSRILDQNGLMERTHSFKTRTRGSDGEATPAAPAAVADAPADEAPADEPPVDEAPVDEPPADEPPVDEAPVDEAPADEPPVDEAPVDEAPADEAPAEEPEAEEESPADEEATEE